MGDRNMGVFQNTVLRKVLLSVFQLPTPFFFFRDTRLDVLHIFINALNVLCFHIFIILSAVSQHLPKCVSSCFARACVFTALFIISVQRAVQSRSVVQWKNIHRQCVVKPLSAGVVQHIRSWSCTITTYWRRWWSYKWRRKAYVYCNKDNKC
jgi:hypothetical protein